MEDITPTTLGIQFWNHIGHFNSFFFLFFIWTTFATQTKQQIKAKTITQLYVLSCTLC